MKWIWCCALVAVLFTVSADAFVGDKMSKAVGDLGPQLVKAVSLAGDILVGIARPSADDLIRGKSVIQKRLGELKEETEAISQILLGMQKDHPALRLQNLSAEKRASLIRLVPTDLRQSVDKEGAISMALVSQIYAGIKVEVQQDAASFEKALADITMESDLEAVNRVGTTRGSLTASLGRLVEFSGRIQELAYLQRSA
jgi:hypothetical protein